VAEADDRPTRIHTVQPAVAVMGDGRHEGRVVLESRILQDGNGPIRDRETRRAIAPDWLAGQILEMVLRTQDVVTKRARTQRVHQLVPVAVRRHLVARGGDFANEVGASSPPPSKHEEGAAGPATREDPPTPTRI